MTDAAVPVGRPAVVSDRARSGTVSALVLRRSAGVAVRGVDGGGACSCR
jgi:hypothetical protein